MNIFILDRDANKCAEYIDDIRLPKMILESTQMMASALYANRASDEEIPFVKSGKSRYGNAHPNHPCTIWAGKNYLNYCFLRDLAIAMCGSYTRRFGKIHACEDPILDMGRLWNKFHYSEEMTPFVLAMPDEYKDKDAVKAYRAYYQSKAQSKGGVRYARTERPDWWGAVV